MNAPRFLSRLKPVDFKTVAKRGCFVYAYLRKDGSPYYVGIAKLARRPTRKTAGEICPPKQEERIRLLRQGLAWEEACRWEVFYIAHYGRVDIGTGALRNRTDGGEGVSNLSPESLARRANSRKGWDPSQTVRENMRQAQLGKKRTPESVEKAIAQLRGKKRPPEIVAKVIASNAITRKAKAEAEAILLCMTIEEISEIRAGLARAKARAAKTRRRRALGIKPRISPKDSGHVASSKTPEKRLEYSRVHQAKTKELAYSMGMTIPGYRQWLKDGCPSDYAPYLRKEKKVPMTRKEICRNYYLRKKARLQEAA